jgi:cyclin-dependent kinase 14
LYDVPFAESLTAIMLQPKPNKRVGAEQALKHRYFSDLPHAIHDLTDGE